MKVAIKNKSEWKYVDAQDILVNDVKLGDLIARLDSLHQAYTQLTTELQNHYVVKKDTAYIVEIDNELKRVNELKLHEAIQTKFPIEFYKVVDNKIVLDKTKIGVLL